KLRKVGLIAGPFPLTVITCNVGHLRRLVVSLPSCLPSGKGHKLRPQEEYAVSSSPSSQREPLTPVEQAHASQRGWFWAIVGGLLVVVVIAVYWGIFAQVPVDYPNPEEHFLYGSIGSDTDSGIPYRLWAVLPQMFPEHLPDPERYRDSP